jgi:hypothetical protein
LEAETAVVGATTVRIGAETQLGAGLKVNQLVRAELQMMDGGLTAVSIMAADGEMPDRSLEVTGVLEWQQTGSWGIGGFTVLVPGEAEITDGLRIGEVVKVHALTGADGALVAREIRRSDEALTTRDSAREPASTPAADGEFEFFGTVTDATGESWVIGGQAVQVTSQTEVKAGVALNVFVKAHAIPQADGTLWAREIEPADDAEATGTPGPDDEIEFTGVVNSMAEDLWTVGITLVRVTANTEVKDVIEVGDRVKVHAQAGADGILVAREVELAGNDDNDNGNDNSGPGGDDDNGNDNSGPGGDDNDNGNDNSGPGGDDDDDNGNDNGNSGPGGDDDDDDDNSNDNSGPGGDDDDDDDNGNDNSGHGGDDDDDDDDNSNDNSNSGGDDD